MAFDRADIAMRLIEERTLAGYSQADFARQLGISREGLRLYENGQSRLSAEFLAQTASLGIDVQYVLTGVKSQNMKEVYNTAQPISAKNSIIQVDKGGSAQIVQNTSSGTINVITTPKHVTKTKAEVKPGIEHISEKEAAHLTELIKDIIILENKLKKSPRSHRSVWASLNSHCKVTSYRLIASKDYKKAEKYLYQWIGRLNSMASAPKKDNSEWRKRKYAYIKINSINLTDWLSDYIMKKYQATSLTELADNELDSVYRAVAAKKNKK